MPKLDATRGRDGETDPGARLAETIIANAARDIVFVMQFLGEPQYRVLAYFQKLVIAELEARGIRREDHLLLPVFIDRHASEMRDFVFAGVALARPFRIEEIERLLGDDTSVIRTDIWDALRNNINAAHRKFVAEADDLPRQLARIEAEADALNARR